MITLYAVCVDDDKPFIEIILPFALSTYEYEYAEEIGMRLARSLGLRLIYTTDDAL